MCLGSICVSIGVRETLPGRSGKGRYGWEEQENPGKDREQHRHMEESRQEETSTGQTERGTETGTEKTVPDFPVPKLGIPGGNKGGKHGTVQK